MKTNDEKSQESTAVRKTRADKIIFFTIHAKGSNAPCVRDHALGVMREVDGRCETWRGEITRNGNRERICALKKRLKRCLEIHAANVRKFRNSMISEMPVIKSIPDELEIHAHRFDGKEVVAA